MHNRWQSLSNTSINTISITVVNGFTVFMLYLVKIFQFYSFVVLQPPLILVNNKYYNFRGMREPENIGMVGKRSCQVASDSLKFRDSRRNRVSRQSQDFRKFRELGYRFSNYFTMLYRQPTKYVNTHFNFFCQRSYWKHGF